MRPLLLAHVVHACAALKFIVEPVRLMRNDKLEKHRLCIRQDVEERMTIMDIDIGSWVHRQKLSVEVVDVEGNLYAHRAESTTVVVVTNIP